jgi:hypothetical protein
MPFLPVPAHVEKVADDEERIINLPGYSQLRIAIVKSSQCKHVERFDSLFGDFENDRLTRMIDDPTLPNKFFKATSYLYFSPIGLLCCTGLWVVLYHCILK